MSEFLFTSVFSTQVTGHFFILSVSYGSDCRKNAFTKQSVGTYSSVGITTSTFTDKALSIGSNFAYFDKFPFTKFSRSFHDFFQRNRDIRMSLKAVNFERRCPVATKTVNLQLSVIGNSEVFCLKFERATVLPLTGFSPIHSLVGL